MSNLTQTGRIEKIFPTEHRNNFAVRILVLGMGKVEYPQSVPFEFTQSYADLLDNFQEGETVTVSFSLRGREWQGKYYPSLSGWKIERQGNAPNVPQTQPQAETATVQTVAANPEPPGEITSTDLPF